MSRRESFLAWPDRGIIGYATLLGSAQIFWWLLAYGGASWLTGLHHRRVRVHLDVELALPFVPAMVLPYLSINVLFLLAPFVLRTRRQLLALTAALAGMTGVAALCFLVLPAETAYAAIRDAGAWAPWVELAQLLALPHNLVPSLHVAMSSLTLAVYARSCAALGKLMLATWAALIAFSTLLTWQHHLVDVAAGLVLAWLALRFIYDRWPGIEPKVSPIIPL